MSKKRNQRFSKTSKILVVVLLSHLLGFATSINAIMETRSPKSATAWVFALNTLPYVAVPAYWFFGEPDFQEYAEARRSSFTDLYSESEEFPENEHLKKYEGTIEHTSEDFLDSILKSPVTHSNHVELLINGTEAFHSIFESIQKAQHYILVQFFTIAEDDSGTMLADLLIKKQEEGVECYVIYDAIGSKLSDDYVNRLEEAGVSVVSFNGFSGITNLYRLNFRNHRKLVICDGQAAWIGGMNLKDDYLRWRDTMVKITGPSVKALQLTFLHDWSWETDEDIEVLKWEPTLTPTPDSANIAVVPSGPADPVEHYTVLTLDAINQAKDRIWIASPYFVPREPIVLALQKAAIRGVDVTILIPEEVDTNIAKLAKLAAWSYIEELEAAGAQFYRYTEPFMHQKVLLADDDFTMIGSANFDTRSFRLNFELTAVISSESFNQSVYEMLQTDKSNATAITYQDIHDQSFFTRLLVNTARLTAPLL